MGHSRQMENRRRTHQRHGRLAAGLFALIRWDPDDLEIRQVRDQDPKQHHHTQIMRQPPIPAVCLILLPLLCFGGFGFAAGVVVAWGDGNAMLGEAPPPPGSYMTNLVKLSRLTLSNAVQVSANTYHSVAVRSDGTAAGWGNNIRGQAIGVATPGTEITNGLVVTGRHILRNVAAVAAGGNFSLALVSNGTAVAWGSASVGETEVPPGLSNVVSLAAGDFHSVALRRDGTTVSWGSRSKVFDGISNIVAVSAARSWFWNDAVVLRDGSVVERLSDGHLHAPSTISNFVAVSCGYNHSLALTADGAVFGWGTNDGGQATGVPTKEEPYDSSGLVKVAGLPLTNVVAIAAGQEYSLALRKDGTVVAWGDKRFYRDVPGGLTNVTAIAAGVGFCLAVTTNLSALNLK